MIITFLGRGNKTEETKRPKYTFDDRLSEKFKLKKNNYTNMLPLLIDNFPDEKIIPVYTEDAKNTQIPVLEDEFGKTCEELFDDAFKIEDTKDFSSIMRLLNRVISQDEDYIIDLTHSFRHLPILATISLISNQTLDTNRVKHIFFAKEKIPNTKETIGEYEIIDLKNYLELANVSYMLSTFNQNYTVSGNMEFTNPLYQQLANQLKHFSEHFLSNSLKAIIDEEMIDDIFDVFDKLDKEEDIANLNNFITKIKSHLQTIKALKNSQSEYEKFYELSKIMDDRGYQLNAITLLFEAIGYYCLEKIYTNVPSAKKHIDRFQTFIREQKQPQNVYSDYTLTNQSRNIIKLRKRFTGDFLFNPQTVDWTRKELKSTPYNLLPKEATKKLKKDIFNYLDKLPAHQLKDLTQYIRDMEALRNNLAHGNSSKPIDNIENLFSKYTKTFKNLILDEDVLQPETFNQIKIKR